MNRTIIGTILFIDIVAFSETPVSQQWAMKKGLTRAIEDSLAKVAEADRILLDTGDGAAICFLGDPEEALFVANDIRGKADFLTGEEAQELRMGINLGPLRIVSDVNGRTNVIGDGINVAQRVMGFAEHGEILVSRSYYEVVARLSEGNEQMFRGLGVRTDKHVREHQLYALLLPGVEAPPQRAQPEGARTESVRPPAPAVAPAAQEPAALVLDPGALRNLGARLSQHIGPLAPVIVSRALRSCKDLNSFLNAVAAPIADENDRRGFLARSSDLFPASEPVEETAPPEPVHVSATPPSQPIDEATIALAARELTRHLGPIAPVLARKTARDAADRHDFLNRLAAKLPDDRSRAAFLARIDSGSHVG